MCSRSAGCALRCFVLFFHWIRATTTCNIKLLLYCAAFYASALYASVGICVCVLCRRICIICVRVLCVCVCGSLRSMRLSAAHCDALPYFSSVMPHCFCAALLFYCFPVLLLFWFVRAALRAVSAPCCVTVSPPPPSLMPRCVRAAYVLLTCFLRAALLLYCFTALLLYCFTASLSSA
jgi:hypothetical protein